MSSPVITFTRQYASGGSDIARLVAAALDWTVIDNEFVEEVARRAGLPPAEVAERDERAPGLRKRLAVERRGADPATVERLVDETDRRRDGYVKTYYGRHRHDVVNYDLVVNSERLGIEGAAALVVAEARRRQWR